LLTDVDQITAAIVDRLQTTSSVRDKALGDCRQLVRWSANSVRASHRGDFAEASAELDHARALATEIVAETRTTPSVYWAGYVQDAMKEYAEAAITNAIAASAPIPGPQDLGVEDAAYLNGLAEAASELRRDVLDLLRSDNLDRATQLLNAMDAIYATLISVDFPDAITGGLRRTTDALRAVLERTRGDLTITINQRRLESAVRAVQSQLGLVPSLLSQPNPPEE
jgi:translin